MPTAATRRLGRAGRAHPCLAISGPPRASDAGWRASWTKAEHRCDAATAEDVLEVEGQKRRGTRKKRRRRDPIRHSWVARE